MRRFFLTIAVLLAAMPAWGLDRPPWDKLTTDVGPDAEVPGWYINLGITGARAMITKEEPTNLLVMFIFKDTPAFGKLEKGDKIVGANGRAFATPHKFGYGVGKFGYDGPIMDFGNALEESQGKLGGKLALDVLRGDQKLKLELQLTTKYGSYSATYPFDCKKSDQVFKEACDYLLREQKTNGLWSGRPHINAFAALALLGSGDKANLPAVKKAMEAMARSVDGKLKFGGLPVWDYGLYGIALGEYYLITREDWVLPELEKINKWLAGAQHPATSPPNRPHIAGGFGHGLLNPAGGNAYGAFNAVTAQAMMAWALMDRCGLAVDDQRYLAAHEFIAKGTNKIGYVWYADEVGGQGYADMGRTGASALAHYLYAKENADIKAFSKLTAECIGNHPDTFIDTHGCPLLGMVWTALGANTDPQNFRKLMDHNRWAFSLSQCADGTFYYQPNRDNNPQDYTAAPRLSATAATALILAVKQKRLQITGAKPVTVKTTASTPTTARPNIILCMTDDQGWGDVSYNGLKKVKTPNLDAMAAAGIRFDRFYAQHPSCSPTRASVMTGRHPYRMNCLWPGMPLRKGEITIAQALKTAGYATAHFGKWHLNGVAGPGKVISESDPFSPRNVGFDESFSVSNYFETNWTFGRNGVAEKAVGDGSDVIVGEALKFAEANVKQNKPFLAVVWYGSPHVPHKPLPEDQQAAGGSAYYGELVGVDRSMGTLRSGLRKLGIADNTLLCFCSDNGSWLDENAPDAHGSNGDLRGKKGELWEGGIHVPGLIEWPARIKRPFSTSVPVCTSDIYPTVVDLLKIDVPNQVRPLDGISLVPLLDGQMKERPRPIGFWHHGETSLDDGPAAWVDNRYKLHKRPGDKYELYDLTVDRSEKTDIAAQKPEIVERMKAELDAWQQSVLRSNRGEDYATKPSDK